MKLRAFACAASALLCVPVLAVENTQWPPPQGVEARMRELQLVMGSRDATAAQREAAREELSSLLKSPAGQARGRTPDEKPTRPARAAIEPLPAMIRPAQSPAVAVPGVAHMEVIEPPRTILIPQTGSVATPSNGFAVDPRTGAVLHGIPGGYIDPRTGRVTPR